MITPETDPSAPTETNNDAEQAIPLAALAADGTPPGQGDEVEFTVKATVSRIEGEMAYVKATAINGQPIPEADGIAEPDADDVMGEAMKADAAAMKE